MKISGQRLSMRNCRILWLVALAAVVFPAVARIPQLWIPFERDEGAYAYMSDVIDHGGLPYRDAFDHKPPGIYYIYNFSFRLFGHDIYAPRITALLSVAGACFLAFLFVYKISSSISAGILSMGLLAWASSSPAYAGFGANAEIFVLPLIAGASLCLISGGYSKRNYFLSGMLYGFAFMIKQIAIPIALFSLVFIIAHEGRKLPRLLFIAAAFLSGFILPFALFTLWFSLRGAFYFYWTGLYAYNRSYAATLGLRDSWDNFLRSIQFILSLDPGTWLAACLGLMALGLSPVRKYHQWLIIAPLTGSLIGIAAGGFFFPHYYLIILPYLAMAAGIGGAALGMRRAEHLGEWLVAILLVGSMSIGLRFSAMPDDEKVRVVYGGDLFSRSLTIGRFLSSYSDKNAKVFIIGSEPQILFYSRLAAPTRFYYYYPLMLPSPFRNEFRNELVSSIITNPPEYLVRVNDPSSTAITGIVSDDFNRRVENLFSGYKALGISIKGSKHISTEILDPGLEKLYGSIVIYKNTKSNQSKGAI